ncbi:hypothetical protein BTM25_46880 [Actinomadura rubteroloni]|uniref:Uncharacterized protein n=1 Tax=Actinomadura rubteroloni TaxID=1926885 RepID=A0A2P4UEN8_9ACTN|nr:DUF5997 family protein [Actinomadura rubteroloni]POM23534.1 hypothetical protein BTM25_46880 [Actinomadura rubteroloni]
MGTSKAKTPQTMKPATAAKKLGILLSAAPAEFQEGLVSRDELNALQADPPSWLANLRREGPHPRQVVAARLRVSASGLARAGITGPLTTAEIENLKVEKPDWLEREQAVHAEVRKEELRLKQQRAKA